MGVEYGADEYQLLNELREQATINRQQLTQLKILEVNFSTIERFQAAALAFWFMTLSGSITTILPSIKQHIHTLESFMPIVIVFALFGLVQAFINFVEVRKNKMILQILIESQEASLAEADKILQEDGEYAK